jgi:hypothetical protein
MMIKSISIKMDVRSAAAVRQVLFEHQKGHSYEFASERITDIRKVIADLDDNIGAALGA